LHQDGNVGPNVLQTYPGINIFDARDKFGDSILHIAIRSGKKTLTKTVMNSNDFRLEDLNERNNAGSTPLDTLISGDTNKSLSVVFLVISKLLENAGNKGKINWKEQTYFIKSLLNKDWRNDPYYKAMADALKKDGVDLERISRPNPTTAPGFSSSISSPPGLQRDGGGRQN
jgi:ankyrin repeat protein